MVKCGTGKLNPQSTSISCISTRTLHTPRSVIPLRTQPSMTTICTEAELMTSRNQLKCRVRSCVYRQLGGGDCSACRCISACSSLSCRFRASASARHRSRDRRRSRNSVRKALIRSCSRLYFSFQRSRLFSNTRASTRQGLLIRSGFLLGCFCARRHFRLLPWKRAPPSSGDSATDFQNSASPITAENDDFSTAQSWRC